MASRSGPPSRRGQQNSIDMSDAGVNVEPKSEVAYPPHRNSALPVHRGQRIVSHIRTEGESGRRGVHPLQFLRICFRSSCYFSSLVNIFWPIVPVAFAVQYARPDARLWNFILPYIAMVPCANLLGFAGQELARKLPHVFGVILETTFGSVVELVLLIILLRKGETAVPVIKAAILGSILANLLLCLGLCFFIGGLHREEQTFHEAVSEVGSNLMLVAGMALILPSVFSSAKGTAGDTLSAEILRISRTTAIILLVAYIVYVYFQMKSHHGLYDEVLKGEFRKVEDGHDSSSKPKLTMTEAVLALIIALVTVTFMALFLVKEIDYLVDERHVKDAFVGLILVPLVEKAAEHITAVDEAWDNHMNFALAHVLGSSIQTALLNTPLIVLIGWGLGVPMELNFEIFDSVVLILAIIAVGNFLRDGKSNYLEGFLCVMVYVIIAISAYFYPDPVRPVA